jgi:NAD(P)-dependent dehydrogenase (short-subunit alcohol dehydrogenase family)
MTMSQEKVALITGANKGIGLEVAKQLGLQKIVVLVGARDPTNGAVAVKALRDLGVSAELVALDVTNPATISEAAEMVERTYGKLDILVNNAGITGCGSPVPSEVTVETMRQVYETNVFGIVAVTNAFIPLLRKSVSGRIVNVSSGLGSITAASDPTSEFYALNYMPYQSSKTALNAVTVAYAKVLGDGPIKVNAADPGYTATDLNAHRGYRTVEQAAQIVVYLATLPNDGPTGTFSNDDGPIPW